MGRRYGSDDKKGQRYEEARMALAARSEPVVSKVGAKRVDLEPELVRRLAALTEVGQKWPSGCRYPKHPQQSSDRCRNTSGTDLSG
jgi:hypothetical protein